MKNTYMLEGLSIGLMLGTALCCAFQFEIPIGAGAGSLIGCAIGAVLKKRREDDYEENCGRNIFCRFDHFHRPYPVWL